MAKPVRKYGKGAVSLAVFEKALEDGSRKEYYSLQRSRKVGDKWENESILLFPEQLADVHEIVGQALEEGENSPSSDTTERKQDKEAVQVVKVYDWGTVVEHNYNTRKDELSRSFLVEADNSMLSIGIGDIEEAVQRVREGLFDNGFRNVVVRRIKLNVNQHVWDEDVEHAMCVGDPAIADGEVFVAANRPVVNDWRDVFRTDSSETAASTGCAPKARRGKVGEITIEELGSFGSAGVVEGTTGRERSFLVQTKNSGRTASEEELDKSVEALKRELIEQGCMRVVVKRDMNNRDGQLDLDGLRGLRDEGQLEPAPEACFTGVRA